MKKEGPIERHRARRAVRKANRVARVDHQLPRRRHLRVVLILLGLAFVFGEVFLIIHAMGISAQHRAVELAGQASEQLNLISASYISGDRTLFDASRTNYNNIVMEFNRNSYMQQYQSDLLRQINDYNDLLHNQPAIKEFMNLRLAVLMLQSELSDVNLSEVSVESMTDIKNSYQDFDKNISELETSSFTPLVEELQAYDKEIIEHLQNVSVCVGVCPTNTIAEYQEKINSAITEHQSVLRSLDRTLSEKFNPARLTNALNVLK